LHGRLTLNELTIGLEDERKAVIETLVALLHEANLVRDVSMDRAHSLTQREVELYEAEITSIGEITDSEHARFQRFREAHVLAIGAGPSMATLVQSALLTGVRQLSVVLTRESPDALRSIQAVGEAANRRDPLQHLEIHNWVGQNPPYVEHIEAADAVLLIADHPMPEIAAIDNHCSATGRVFVPAVSFGDEAWIGPVCAPANPRTRWMASIARLVGSHEDILLESKPSRYLVGPTAGIVANHALYRWFSYATDIDASDNVQSLLCVNLKTLETSRHQCLPSPPYLPSGPISQSDFVMQIAELERRSTVDDASFLEAISPAVDARLGVIREVGEQKHRQFPVRVAEAKVVDPKDPTAGHLLSTYGVALDAQQARVTALRRALELYASRAVDLRRMHTRGQAAHVGARISTTQPPSGVFGVEIVNNEPVVVPSELAYPCLSGHDRSTDLIGVALGSSWRASVETALLAHLRAISIAQLSESRRPFPQLDIASLRLDGEVAELRELTSRLNEETAVFDISPFEAVVVLAFTLADRTVAYSASLSSAAALAEGLSSVLLAAQSPELFATIHPRIIELPMERRGNQSSQLPVDIPERFPEDHRPLLNQAVRRLGYRPVAIPLDHDPALYDLAPNLVRVVLLDS